MALKLPHNKLPTVKRLYHDNSVKKHTLYNELVNLCHQYNAGIYLDIENGYLWIDGCISDQLKAGH